MKEEFYQTCAALSALELSIGEIALATAVVGNKLFERDWKMEDGRSCSSGLGYSGHRKEGQGGSAAAGGESDRAVMEYSNFKQTWMTMVVGERERREGQF